jgi:hypothetical protein
MFHSVSMVLVTSPNIKVATMRTNVCITAVNKNDDGGENLVIRGGWKRVGYIHETFCK